MVSLTSLCTYLSIYTKRSFFVITFVLFDERSSSLFKSKLVFGEDKEVDSYLVLEKFGTEDYFYFVDEN